MRSRKRKYIWVGLLLTCILSVPGKAMAWSEEQIGDFVDLSGNGLSDNESRGIEVFHDEPEIQMDSVSDGEVDGGIISENEMPRAENVVSEEGVSEDQEDGFPEISGNGLSENLIRQEENIDMQNRFLNIVLPTEVPFDIIYWGEEKREAWIRSDQYCIENRGYDDVRISIEGVCSGENAEDYAIVGATTEEVCIQNKKNVWAYLKWEDEERGAVERPEILMGDASNPGKGEIILKAPERNDKGEIIGENRDSKAYFSFIGDMKSDMDQGLGSEEVKMELSFFLSELEEPEQNMEIPREEYVREDPAVNMEVEPF